MKNLNAVNTPTAPDGQVVLIWQGIAGRFLGAMSSPEGIFMNPDDSLFL